MFWGLIMEPSKRYSQVIKRPFHISMAALDLTNSDGQPSQVMIGYEGRNYLLCTLQKPDLVQCPLDLNFEEGTTVSFATNGKSHIHLTGYIIKDVYEEEEGEESDKDEFEISAQKRTNENTEKQSSSKKAKKEEEVSEKEEEVSEKEEDVSDEEEDSDDSDDSVDLEKLTGLPNKDESSDVDSEGDYVESSPDEDEEEEDPELEEKMDKLINSYIEDEKKIKKAKEEKQKKAQQNKETTPLKQTPGPKIKKQENGIVEGEKKKGKEDKKGKQIQASTPNPKVLRGGVIVEDLKEGHGNAAGNGKFLYVYYEGFLKGKKKPFDSCSKSPGFGFRLGKGEVIKGWDIGLEGMKVGGKRRVTVPPQLAYGAKGSLPAIPPNSTLVFEVDLWKMK